MKALNNYLIAYSLIAMAAIPLTVSAVDLTSKEYLVSNSDLSVFLTNTEKSAVPVEIVKDSRRSITHLNVNVREIVSLESFCISPDNGINNKFYYDRQHSRPFAIPEGYSFVVTDIIAHPACYIGQGNSNDFYLALVEGPAAVRSFTIKLRGDAVKHYALNGGITYTSGNEPRPRNTSFSANRMEIQVLGYFVIGNALDPGEPRF